MILNPVYADFDSIQTKIEELEDSSLDEEISTMEDSSIYEDDSSLENSPLDNELETNEDDKIYESISNQSEYILMESLSIEDQLTAKALSRDVMNFLRWRHPRIAKIKLKKLGKISSMTDEYFYVSGAVHFTEGEFEKAKRNLLIATSINPIHDPALFLLGVIYAKLKEWNLASQYLERCLKQAPYSPYYRLNLAYTYFVLNDYKKAQYHLNICLSQKPNFDHAIILSKLLGESGWDQDFKNLKYISKETKKFLEADQLSTKEKEIFVDKRLYTYYPILK